MKFSLVFSESYVLRQEGDKVRNPSKESPDRILSPSEDQAAVENPIVVRSLLSIVMNVAMLPTRCVKLLKYAPTMAWKAL